MDNLTGWLKTPGQLTGEMMDMFSCQWKTIIAV